MLLTSVKGKKIMNQKDDRTLMTPDKAKQIADINNQNVEDDWSYEVLPVGKYCVVQVTDEDDFFLGYF